MDDFFIPAASCVDDPSTCTNPQRGFADRARVSSSQLAQDRTSDTVSESQSLRGLPRRIREVPRSANYDYEYVWVSRIFTP